ncbi:MAG: restriction endonuclease subunit S [Solirubrobacteraceae bacterium]
MTRIDELIAAMCPDGVAFAEVSRLFTLRNGYTPPKAAASLWEDGTVPWFRMEDIREHGQILADSMQHISEAGVKGGSLFAANSLIVATSATIGAHALITAPFLCNQRFTCLTLKPEFENQLDTKFLFYYCFVLNDWCSANTTTSSFASVDMAGFRRFKFPIPPLIIQREIVAVLDRFTELEARRVQYEHYRDRLLTFKDGVRTSKFGDLATIVRGGSPRPIQAYLTDDDDGISWIKIGDVAAGSKFITSTAERIRPEGAGKSRCVSPGDFVLSNSMSFGRPYIVQIHGCIHDGWLAIKDFGESFNSDFLYHLLRSSSVYRAMARRASSGTVQNLNADIVKSLVLPVPDIEEQQQIVSVLDRFDALVNDLSVGLPAELNARRQQYEYYRDRLLTFKEAA